MEHQLPFKLDKKGIWYLDSSDIITKEIVFPRYNNRPYERPYENRTHFYTIDGIDDYIIKDCTMYPLLFNRSRNLKLLQELVKRQKDFSNIDFPVAYYKGHEMLKGIVIPYYKDSVSLNELIYFKGFNKLKEYYNHDNNEINNVVNLLLDILKLIITMYKKGIYYVDINSSNFLVYNNIIKVIDFEPDHVFFSDRNNWHLNRILKNYELLVYNVINKFNFKPVLFHSGDDFYDTELNVKILTKRLER